MSGRRSFGVPVMLIALAASGAVAASCNRSVDIKEAVEVVDTSSGWYDAGIVEGKNKIVPSVTFKLRKKPDADLSAVALNIAFRYVPPPGSNVEEPWDDFFLQRAEFKNGNETDPLVVRLPNGYTGEPPQSRLDMLKNSNFRDVRARIFAKLSSSQWVEIGAVDVQRQLLVR
jgi:hypothetical protein